MTQLVRYEQARTALIAANSYDEVRDIRNQAEATAAYARQAKDTELIKYATEIKVRAERKCGEMLATAEKNTGAMGVGPIAVASFDRNPPTLAEMGITKDQSSRYQSLASMSDEHFEAAVETAKDTAGEVTTAFMLREAAKNKPQGKPRTGAKADAFREELKEAKERGVSMLETYARLTLSAVRAQDSFTDQERSLLDELTEAIAGIPA